MSSIDQLGKLPWWQKLLVWFLVSGLLGGAWYSLYYADEVEARESAAASAKKAQDELAQMQAKLATFEEDQRQAQEDERKLKENMATLPMSASTVDNLMQHFQQTARAIGLTLEKWTPSGEEKLDFYARLPVKIEAVGSWHQIAEFFRRVAELRQIVSIDALELESQSKTKADVAVAHPPLRIEFEASTYRFLTDEELQAQQGKTEKRKRRRSGS